MKDPHACLGLKLVGRRGSTRGGGRGKGRRGGGQKVQCERATIETNWEVMSIWLAFHQLQAPRPDSTEPLNLVLLISLQDGVFHSFRIDVYWSGLVPDWLQVKKSKTQKEGKAGPKLDRPTHVSQPNLSVWVNICSNYLALSLSIYSIIYIYICRRVHVLIYRSTHWQHQHHVFEATSQRNARWLS